MTHALTSGWRKIGSLGILFLAASVPGFSQAGPPINCNAAATPVTVRAGGAAERTADLVVTCAGGTPTAIGQTVLPASWSLTFGSTVTSRPLAAGWSDALLVVDEPQPANQLACLTTNGACTIGGTGVPQRTYDGSLGHPNVFQAEFSGSTLTWRSIPFDPPGAGATRTFRFTNLRVAMPVTPGILSVTVGAPAGQLFVNLTNGTQAVAVGQTPISTLVSGAEASGGRLSKFTLNIQEQFENVFKSASAAGPGPSFQASPGGVPFSYETGFYNPNLGASPRGSLSLAGLPDNGTRVRVVLSTVPTSATISVPLTVNFGLSSVAQLVATDSNGIGAYNPAASTVLPNNKGIVTAIYEITQGSAKDADLFSIPFTLTYVTGAPFLQSLNGDVALAPVHQSQIADASPIPRFNNSFQFTATAPRDPLSIVTTSLLSGAVGSAYSQAIEAAGGVQPYTIFSVPVPPAPGITLSSTGLLSGTPTTTGTFAFTATVRDATQSSVSKQFSLTIAAAGSLLQTSLSKLSFNAALGGNVPPLQVFRVNSAQNGLAFAVTVDGGSAALPAPSWIQVTPLSGTAPGLVTVGVNQANLLEGSYSARVRISIPSNPNLAPVDVFVTLSVKPVAALLESSLLRLTFTARAPSPAKRDGSLLLRNAGGGGAIPFTASVVQRSSWIVAVSPGSGSATPQGTPVRITIDSTGLVEGIYRDVVRFTSAVNNIDVPVVLRVAPAGPLLDASPAGVRFSMREGARTLASREVKVFNRDPASTLLWSADLIRGAEYFSIGPASGIATSALPGSVRISPRPETTGLAPGAYYGLVRINAPSAAYSPRYVVAVLQVQAASQPVDLDLDTGGMVFTAFTGGPQSRRVVTLNAASQSALAYQAAASTLDGAAWLTVSPTSGNLTSGQSVSLAIAVDPRTLTAGIYRGEVTVATADTAQGVPVTLIVTDAIGDPVVSKNRAAACSPNRMAVGTTGLTDNFTVPAGWPATLSVEVRDNCGTAVSNATVVARFSNGDPPMTLDSDDLTGVYTGTWQPSGALDQANVTISALNADFPEARAALVGTVRENKVPTLFRNGTIHNLDPKLGGLLSPGLVAQMYGTDMAAVAESTGSVPLSTNYKNTSVLVGPYEAPLYYVSPGQLVVQLPFELPANRSYPILVSANGAITIPDQIDIVSVQPGVAAFSDGKIIAQHSNFVLVDATNPAKRGEFLIMYLVGLGGTNQAIASGAPSPGVLPLPVLNVPPTVTIDGATAQTVFAGLTPFGVGLYQINFKVPDNARLNTPLEVLVKQGAYTANVTTLTVVQ